MSLREARRATHKVGVRARLAVAAKALAHCGRSSRGAKTGVSVHVKGSEAGLANEGERVVLFEEELAGGVEGDRVRRVLLAQLLRLLDHEVEGVVPRSALELARLRVADHLLERWASVRGLQASRWRTYGILEAVLRVHADPTVHSADQTTSAVVQDC